MGLLGRGTMGGDAGKLETYERHSVLVDSDLSFDLVSLLLVEGPLLDFLQSPLPSLVVSQGSGRSEERLRLGLDGGDRLLKVSYICARTSRVVQKKRRKDKRKGILTETHG